MGQGVGELAVIISIRGTMGAGKSTLVRRVMDRLGTPVPFYPEGARVPSYLAFDSGISVLGHYNNVKCCGVDTIANLGIAYALAEHLHQTRGTVIMEGRCDGDGPRRISELAARGIDCRVLVLTTDIDTCVAGVKARGAKIQRSRIESNHRKILGHVFSVPRVFCGDREQCYREAMTWLNLTP